MPEWCLCPAVEKISAPAATSADSGLEAGDGRVGGLRVAETGYTDQGREPIVGSEHVIDADLVLIAMGFTGPEPIAEPEFHLGTSKRGAFTRGQNYASEIPGVFVAGDAGRGQSLIVWAIAEGRAVAAATDAYLTGATVLPAPVTATDRALS